MAVLISDEDVHQELVEHLRALGHDVVTAREVGRANLGIPDPEVLAFAVAQGRTLLTRNRSDFHRLHRLHPDHEGIITFTDDPDLPALAQRIHDAITALDTLSRQLIRVIRPNPS